MTDRAYYDQSYDAGLSHRASARHAILRDFVISKVPPDAQRILDAGCGDGAILDVLPDRELIVGIDFSVAGLRQAGRPVACAEINTLCFPDQAFDLVVTTEVLEHLPQAVLDQAVRELARVARTYCIVSVPNRERLRYGRRTCPTCWSSMHAFGHLQSYDASRLASLIPNFRMTEVSEIGPVRLDFPAWLIQLRRLYAGEPTLPAGGICAVCGYVRAGVRTMATSLSPPSKRRLSFLARKRPSWLVATYVRVGEPTPNPDGG